MPPYPKRGEVFWARLDKLRPVIVLSIDALNKYALDVCIVPVTTKEHMNFSMRIPLRAGEGGLDRDCWAKCDQVTTLEKSLLKYPALGLLPAGKFARVQEQVKVALGLL
jgi:mRNA-degrading endonuclease toxin of MazEF toxin-antitoxin module